MAFDRRCYVRKALSRRLLRSRGAFTASKSVFLIKIDEKRHVNFKHDKANKTLYKSDAHTCIRISFTMSIKQQTGLLLVYMQAQQIHIAADAASIVL